MKKKILVADDEKEILYFLKLILELAEFDVILAKDGVECIEKFEREKPDLVICDVRMPKMTGLDVYSEINDRANVIVISGVVSERQIPEEIVERGDFVAKPLSPKDFIEKIKERLNG